MSKIMPKLTTGILLAVPALASAEPIFVEYDTRVSDLGQHDSEYRAGDRVAGWLRIDPDLAPPDLGADSAPDQQIRSFHWLTGRDFVTGTPGWSAQRFSEDVVGVIDDGGRFSHQSYSIWDSSFSRQGGGSTILQLQIYSDDRVDDFIHGKGLAQSFDSQDLEGDIKFVGRLTRVLDGVRRTFDLVLNRLTVTPGRCRAP
jgi:hypothetical protein